MRVPVITAVQPVKVLGKKDYQAEWYLLITETDAKDHCRTRELEPPRSSLPLLQAAKQGLLPPPPAKQNNVNRNLEPSECSICEPGVSTNGVELLNLDVVKPKLDQTQCFLLC